MRIADRRFEARTASPGADGAFRFDRDDDRPPWLGVRPREAAFDVRRKGAVAGNRAGRSARVAEGRAVAFGIAEKPAT